MDKKAQIRERLKQMASEVGPDFTMLAQVKSVDEDALTCDLYDDDSELDFYDVRLRPVLDGKEFITIIPKVDSWVLAARIEDSDDWMIVAFGEVEKCIIKIDEVTTEHLTDKWSLKIGTTLIEQNSTGLLIKKGDDTLKDVIEMIIDACIKIVVFQGTNPDYTKLAQAKVKLNNLLR